MPFHDIKPEEMHARRRAGRQVPIHREDRHFSGCQLVRRGEVFVKTAGTHGASSDCFQRRVAVSIARLTQYVIAQGATNFLLADDIHLKVLRLGHSTYPCRLLFSPLLSRAARSRGIRLQEVRRRSGCVLSCCCGKPNARAHEQRRGVGSQEGPGAETRARSHERKGGMGSFDGPGRRRQQSWSRLGFFL